MSVRPDHLFVYGTLLPGEARWACLEPFVEGPGPQDSTIGTLYDTGAGYPAFRRTGHRTVTGMTFALRADVLDRALDILDAVEGAVDGLYRRVRVMTGRGVDAWVYEYGGGLTLTPIPGGSWLTR